MSSDHQLPAQLAADPRIAPPETLAQIQMQLEYEVDAQDRLSFRSHSTQRARFVAYKLPSGALYFYHRDLAPEIIDSLGSISVDHAFAETDRILSLLGLTKGAKVWQGRSYVFDSMPSLTDSAEVIQAESRFLRFVDSQVISNAYSARESPTAAEIIVETSEPWRRRKHATAVTLAWARHQFLEGRIPYYSHLKDNFASEGLARSLGLRCFCEVAAYG